MKIIYIPLMIILIFLECIINALSFALFFGEALIIAYSISLVLGLLIIGGAHFSADLFNRAQHKNVDQSFTASYIMIIFIFLLVFIVMWFLALCRQEYIDIINMDTNIISLTPNETLGTLISYYNLDFEGYIHLIANIAIFVVAFIASFYHHNKKIN